MDSKNYSPSQWVSQTSMSSLTQPYHHLIFVISFYLLSNILFRTI